MCNNFYNLSALVGCWFSVLIRRIVYNFLNGYTAFAVSGKVGTPKSDLTTPVGDCPTSVRNRCVIEVCGSVFVLSLCFLNFFSGCGGFCYRTGSYLFLFFFSCDPIALVSQLFLSRPVVHSTRVLYIVFIFINRPLSISRDIQSCDCMSGFHGKE